MTRLIDADALIDDIRKHSESYFADDFAHIWVDKQPTVDAIPVEWLYDLADKKEEEKDIKLSAMIKGVVALWHREKRNDSD